MFKTPSKPGTTTSKSPYTPKKKGLLEDGQWLCDCTPRKPAICQTVKKETKNKGKRFYACQDRECEMFLWEDAAKARERDAILRHNCRSENGITGTIRPKTPEPAPPLNLQPRSAGPKLTDAKITDYAERWARPQQRVFKSLDDPAREAYLLSDLSDSDTDELAGPAGPAGRAGLRSPSQVQNRQRSYLSQPGQVDDISQTLRDSGPSRPLGSGVTAAAEGGGGGDTRAAFTFQAHHAHPSGLDPVTPTAKMKRDVFIEDDEFGGDDLDDSETEKQLARIADESARKQERTKDVYKTPSTRRTVDEGIRNDLGLPTPVSRRPGLLVASEERERSAKRQRHVDFKKVEDDEETQSESEDVGDPTTPTPYRKTDALATATAAPEAAATTLSTSAAAAEKSPAKPAGTVDDFPKIADEVLSLLSGQPVSESTKRTLRAAMERHEMRVKGLVRGRQAARAGIAKRDERIAELQARVVSLENGRKMDRERLRELSVIGERLMRLSEDV
ncbi:DNA topoisomerase 3-alpha [Cytospora mali]|uniref:DNA topoisomerase 3-alpha n=1 Tax=Cytospora mali TaxID=578113 RepID=A0A194UQR1_CYTMA|nr:DNA topoisomerase 3-alpha [Valsa mali var. pyri (nom. inval.)]